MERNKDNHHGIDYPEVNPPYQDIEIHLIDFTTDCLYKMFLEIWNSSALSPEFQFQADLLGQPDGIGNVDIYCNWMEKDAVVNWNDALDDEGKQKLSHYVDVAIGRFYQLVDITTKHTPILNMTGEGDSTTLAPVDSGKALWEASHAGNHEKVSKLVHSGADLNHTEGWTEATPLHVAAQQGHIRVMELLLQAGANVNALTSENSTPLHLCDRDAHATNLLLKSGADINVENIDGNPPWYMAKFGAMPEDVKAAYAVNGYAFSS